MIVIITVFLLVSLALNVTASKRCRQYKLILNRVAPTDPQYISMLTSKQRGVK